MLGDFHHKVHTILLQVKPVTRINLPRTVLRSRHGSLASPDERYW